MPVRLFWQMGSAPCPGGGFGDFHVHAPAKIEYAIDRFAMEAKRQRDVLDRRLAQCEYVAGDCYTIADMAILPWHGLLATGWPYDAVGLFSACRTTDTSIAGPTCCSTDRR